MNKHAMRLYVFFRALSFIMHVVRDIAAGVALWLGNFTVLGNQILWGPWLWVVGITAVASLPLAYWAYRTGPASRY